MDIKNAFVHIFSVLQGKVHGIYLDKSKEAGRNTHSEKVRSLVKKVLKFASSKNKIYYIIIFDDKGNIKYIVKFNL